MIQARLRHNGLEITIPRSAVRHGRGTRRSSPRQADQAAADRGRHCATRSAPCRFAAAAQPAARSRGVQRHHPSDAERTDDPRDPSGARGRGRPAGRITLFNCHRHAPGEHARRARRHAGRGGRLPLPDRAERRTGIRAHARSARPGAGTRSSIHREFARLHDPHPHGIHRAAFLRGLLGRRQGDHARAGASRHGYAKPRRGEHGQPPGPLGDPRGNPLRREIDEAMALVRPDFLVNVALNRDKAITRCFAGDPRRRATGRARRSCAARRLVGGGRAVRHRRHHELRLGLST